jgi:hypothetical protein
METMPFCQDCQDIDWCRENGYCTKQLLSSALVLDKQMKSLRRQAFNPVFDRELKKKIRQWKAKKS